MRSVSKQLESWMADLKVETLDSISCTHEKKNERDQIMKELLVQTRSMVKGPSTSMSCLLQTFQEICSSHVLKN